MANISEEKVIVIDSDSDEEPSKKAAGFAFAKKTPSISIPPTIEHMDIEAANEDSSSSMQNVSPDSITRSVRNAMGSHPELIEIDITEKASGVVDVSKDDDLNSTDDDVTCLTADVAEKLNFQDMLDIIDKATETPPMKHRTKSGHPVCCNSWCANPSSIEPLQHIRDYYHIPSGKYQLCNDCVEQYYTFIEKAARNLETGGNMLEGLGSQVNEFVLLEGDESEEDHEELDPELSKLLSSAIEETMNEFSKEVGLKKTFERTRDKVEENLNKIINEGTYLVQKITSIETDLYKNLEEFKDVFRCKAPINLPELDIPIENMSNVQRPKRVVSNVLEDVSLTANESHPNEPASLPPFGQLVRPPPQVGDMFYAMKEYNYSEWIPFKVTDIVYDCDNHGVYVETFNLETIEKGVFLKRVVSSDHVAYMPVPAVRLGIGSRIIGAYNQNMGNSEPKTFFSGMIAELPTNVNNFRYLVFFDNGQAQYCPHEDLRVVYKPTKKIHEYFVGFHSNFVQTYLSNFPERPMVKTNTEHFVRVELNGFWISGQVDKLDGSLARVTFHNDNHSEWIYRGSPRLRPVYERLQANLRSGLSVSDVPRSRFPVIRPSSSSKSGAAVTEIIIDSSDDEDSGSSMPSRAVAKKSTSRPVLVPSRSYSAQSKRYFEKRTITRSSVTRKLPAIMLTPNTFHYHKCSQACVTWVKYAEEKTHGVNPLAIPSIFAFKRDIDVTSAVSYTAPCGKKLKNIQEVLKYLSETLIPLTLDMFDFDIRTQIFDEYIVAPQHIIMQDISFGAERNPIACVNEVDSHCPDLMQYMTERRPLEGVNINLDPGFLVCCDCEDNCRDRSKCRCWRLTIDSYKPFNVGEEKRHITKIGYQYQRLDQNLLSGVYECNSNCRCNRVTCINRVVQHPIRHKLQLFKTPKKGWGTRCLNDIPQGVFICTYVGNILTEPSANETGTINGDEYFAELDHIEVMEESKADFEAQAEMMTDEDDEDSEEELPQQPRNSRSGRALRSSAKRKHHSGTLSVKPARKEVVNISDDEANSSDDEMDSVRKFYGIDETVYVMDAKIAGNIGRYFNHSCDPNIFVQNVYVDTHDLRFPWVAFFALRHIPAGSELTWDYRYKIGSVPGKILYCYCGSSNCRKRLL